MEAMSHWMKAHVLHRCVGVRFDRVASQLSHVRTSFPLVTCAGLYELTTDYVLVIVVIVVPYLPESVILGDCAICAYA